MRFRPIILAAHLLCLPLVGCGFHLLTPSPAALALQVRVIDDGAPLIGNSLAKELRLRQIPTIGENPDVVLMLRSEQVGNRLLAVDSNGRAAEYRLEHTLEVSERKGQQRGDWQKFTATRDYTYDESNVLGKSQEQLLIRQKLREELARRIVERYVYSLSASLVSTEIPLEN